MFTLQNIIIYLIVAIIILLVIKYFFCDEYFTEVSMDSTSSMSKFVGLDKKLHLSVTLNGKEYYLIPIEKSYCGISESNQKDCTGVVIVLKEIKDYDDENKIAKEKMLNEQKVCNVATKLDCETKIKAKTITSEVTAEMESILNQEIQNECKDTYESCEKNYQAPGVFMIKKVDHFDKKSKKDLYNLLGSVSLNGSSKFSALSTVGPNSTLELVCLDGVFNNDLPFSSVELEEVISQGDKDMHPSFRIKFLLPQRFDNGMEVTEDGNVVYKGYYVGMCAGDKELKCTADGKDHFRLCLYNSLENPYVLKFTPKLIN